MVTFIHTADVHLDAPLQFLAEKHELRQHDFRQTMRRIRDLVLSKQADFWLIAGDLLEYHGGTRASASFLQELFASVEPTQVFVAPGNHDPWMEDSFYRTLPWPPNVLFFTPEWGAFEFPEKSCVVYGWGFPHAHVSESPLAQFPGKLDGYRHHLMVLHGTVGEAHGHHSYAPVSLADLAQTGMDYVALGHIHKPQRFVHPQRSVPFAAYPGSPEGLSAKETGERYVLYGRVDDQGAVTLEELPVQSRQIHRMKIGVGGVETVDGFAERVLQALEQAEREDLYYVTLTGERASHVVPPLELLSRQCAEFFYLQFEDKTWPDVDEQKLMAGDTILARWLTKLAAAEADAADERSREVARMARREALKRIGGGMG